MKQTTTAQAPISTAATDTAPNARIVKLPPRRGPETKPTPAERKLAGHYRVIHGSLVLPRPPQEYTRPDGTRDPWKVTTVFAKMGDEVWLNDEDAARMLDADIVEPLDSVPSRVGKVFTPPKPGPMRSPPTPWTVPADVRFPGIGPSPHPFPQGPSPSAFGGAPPPVGPRIG